MSDSVWIAVVTAVSTLAAGLGGVWLTLHHQAGQRRADREDQQRLEQREAIRELVDAGTDWCGSEDAMILAAAVVTDTVALSRLDTFNAHGAKHERLRRALGSARLVVVEPQLQAGVRALSQAVEDMGAVLGEVMTSAKDRGRAAPERIGTASGRVDAIRRALRDLEDLALERFSV